MRTRTPVARRWRWAIDALLLALGLACVGAAETVSRPLDPPAAIDRAAEDYVRLALALGRHAPREIDSYFGPARLAPAATGRIASLADVESGARAIVERVEELSTEGATASGSDARRARLAGQARALAVVAASTRTRGRLSFDEEARVVYGLDDTAHGRAADVEAARAELDRLLPGSGTLADRLGTFRRRFVVPQNRRRAVMDAAIEACRTRTLAHWRLPSDERLQVVWGGGGPWGAWHRYLGAGMSTLEISTDSLELVDNAVDLACHEAYPGHHAQFVVLDSTPPVELTVAPLRSPVSLLLEGAASYAVDLAFPPAARLAFERDVLFPLAGLDGRDAAAYMRVRALMRRVEAAIPPVVRAYRDGRVSREAAAARLKEDAFVGAPGPLLQFVDELGPYVVGYGLARDRVAAVVDARARAAGRDHWWALHRLLVESDPAVLQSRRPVSGITRQATGPGGP